MTSQFKEQVKKLWNESHDILLISKLIKSDNRKYRATCWIETIELFTNAVVDPVILRTMGEDFRLAESKSADSSMYTAIAMDLLLNINHEYYKIFDYIEPDVKRILYSAVQYGSEFLINTILSNFNNWGNKKYTIQNTLMSALEKLINSGRMYESIISQLLKLINTSLNSILIYAVSPSFYSYYLNNESDVTRDFTYIIIQNNPNGFSDSKIDNDVQLILDNFIIDENDIMLLINKGLFDFSFIDDKLSIETIARLYMDDVKVLEYNITNKYKLNEAVEYIASTQENINQFLVPRVADIAMRY